MPDAPLLGYCANLHAAESFEGVLNQLDTHGRQVRELVGREIGIGLWFPASVAAELAADAPGGRVDRLRGFLRERGLVPYTINGFPHGDFHSAVVKHRVYTPVWGDPRRTRYTQDLAVILAQLLPEDARASISTVPIGWPGNTTQEAAGEALRGMHAWLGSLHTRTGRHITVDLEPEPGCALDTASDVVGFFSRELPDHPEYLGVCHDVCHSAVMFEPQELAMRRYADAGIRVNKVQVSSAVRSGLDDPEAVIAALERFAEPRYLHQSTLGEPGEEGVVKFFDDLPALLSELRSGRPVPSEARVHFHVPVHLDCVAGLGTTQDQIVEAVRAAQEYHGSPTLEIETYAWGVLPERERPESPDALADGIAQEILWLAHALEGG